MLLDPSHQSLAAFGGRIVTRRLFVIKEGNSCAREPMLSKAPSSEIVKVENVGALGLVLVQFSIRASSPVGNNCDVSRMSGNEHGLTLPVFVADPSEESEEEHDEDGSHSNVPVQESGGEGRRGGGIAKSQSSSKILNAAARKGIMPPGCVSSCWNEHNDELRVPSLEGGLAGPLSNLSAVGRVTPDAARGPSLRKSIRALIKVSCAASIFLCCGHVKVESVDVVEPLPESIGRGPILFGA